MFTELVEGKVFWSELSELWSGQAKRKEMGVDCEVHCGELVA